jgi:hypothetical protein
MVTFSDFISAPSAVAAGIANKTSSTQANFIIFNTRLMDFKGGFKLTLIFLFISL